MPAKTTGEAQSRFVSRLTRETLAIVMAGGRGLAPHATDAVAGRNPPCLSAASSASSISRSPTASTAAFAGWALLTQYKSHSLIRHLQQGWGFLRGQFGEFIELLPAEQRGEAYDWYSGTANAVYQNLDFIRTHQPAYVLILAGDHIYKMDYGPMIAQHARTKAKVTVGCIEVPLDEAKGFGVMQVDENNRIPRVRREALRAQGTAGQARIGAREHGHLCLRRPFFCWISFRKTRASVIPATTSARTSCRR